MVDGRLKPASPVGEWKVAMPDWLIAWLGQIQRGIVRTLATELRAGGLGSVALASSLVAPHALTPGHGKLALAAYFLTAADRPLD